MSSREGCHIRVVGPSVGARREPQRPSVTQASAEARGGVAPYALDPGNAERLWELSLKLLAL